jgi:hypothetical protein
MCKTTIIHVDADAFYAQLKAQSIKTDELKAKGYTPEKIDEMEEMNILKALNENQIKPCLDNHEIGGTMYLNRIIL